MGSLVLNQSKNFPDISRVAPENTWIWTSELASTPMSAVLPPAAGPAHVGLDSARAQHEEGEVGVLHRQARSQHVLH